MSTEIKHYISQNKASLGKEVIERCPIRYENRPKPNLDHFKESMVFNTKHLTVKEKVKSLLLKDRYARKNYFYLCLLYWVSNNDITMNIDFKDFDKITKPETISRVTRELVEEARKGNKELKWLLNDEETLDKRENLRELNREYYQDKNTERMVKVIK